MQGWVCIGRQWLTEEERAELKAQEEAARMAEEERKKRVRVTFDLIGRKVVAADDDCEGAMAEQAEREETARLAEIAAKATAAHSAEGGGAAAREAEKTAKEQLRITANTTIKGPAPVFMMPAVNRQEPVIDKKARTLPAKRAEARRAVRTFNKQQAKGPHSRLQHDGRVGGGCVALRIANTRKYGLVAL
eukprot:gene21853-26305_t